MNYFVEMYFPCVTIKCKMPKIPKHTTIKSLCTLSV